MSNAIKLMRMVAFYALTVAVHAQPVTHSNLATEEWGTFDRPFSKSSPWNTRPINPVLSDFEIPESKYYPSITAGEWSTGVFLAKADGPSQVISKIPGTAGIYVPDLGGNIQKIEIKNWPSDVAPALESDGHADIIDVGSGIIHSFFKLKKINNEWHAALYAWSRLDGNGWGDPSRYYQGARATGIPASAGLIRTKEISDGQKNYSHALAISLTYNALSANPSYIYPATAADQNASSTNFGKIPEGALLMLPSNYPTERIKNIKLRKIAETLKVYGGYVIDRNIGTPFAIYVEKGSGFNLFPFGWDAEVSAELQKIRAALRQVVSFEKWVDADGMEVSRSNKLNIISMRGPWVLKQGSSPAEYDMYKDELVFPPGEKEVISQVSPLSSVTKVAWAIPVAGEKYEFKVYSSSGNKLKILITDVGGARLYESRLLGGGDSSVFEWPEHVGSVYLVANGVLGKVSTSLRGELVRQ